MTFESRIKKLEAVARQNDPPYFITALSKEEAEKKAKEYWKKNPYGREPEITIFASIEEMDRSIEEEIEELIRRNPGLTEKQLIEYFLKDTGVFSA
ncbi:hypothetical protein PITCH_A1960007 [uncultured Desulfobacterium sp.]|uniref:Uncharacterized protein n=1 Tax=uncultured Desulfobacterium sp. TaxID=201089 RepID=A0A445MWD2_9BACT|nr:hypothetical protein PITCH_A1960007 [uncultured Desulfobacterium sp.]